MEHEPILTFKSRMEGRNADVSVYPDRIEWAKASALGVKGKRGTDVIAVKALTSVTTKKDGLIYTKVTVIASGNTIEFRVGHVEAANIKETLTQLLLGSHSTQRVAPPPAPPAPSAQPSPSTVMVALELKNLAELRDAGVLTDAEFETQKARLLA